MLDEILPLKDRVDAGRKLAKALAPFAKSNPVVLGIPRGGVPVAAEVARELGAELDVLVARKLGAPGQRELAMGAVTANGGIFLNDEIVDAFGVSGEEIEAAAAEEREEARRREELFRGGRPPLALEGRTVILVDDGLATGATMRAAVRSVRQRRPARIVVAVPVGSREARGALEREAGEVVCLATPDPFHAVGAFYRSFAQTSDEEVIGLLGAHAAAGAAAR